MTAKQNKFHQSLFVGGISQTGIIPSNTQVADCRNLDLSSEYGSVVLAQISTDRNPPSNTEPVTNFAMVGFDIIGRSESGNVPEKRNIVFDSWSVVSQDGQTNIELVGSPTGSDGDCIFALSIPELGERGYNFFVTPAGTGNGFDIYYMELNQGNSTLSARINSLNRDSIQESMKNINSDIEAAEAVAATGIYLDNFLYMALGDGVYRIELVGTTFAVERVLSIEKGFGVVKMIEHGDYLHIYATDLTPEKAGSVRQENYLYIWRRGTDAWQKKLRIPGTFLDAVKHKEVDYIFVDDSIAYFNGEVFTIIRKIPQTEGYTTIAIPGSGASCNNYLVFATSNFNRTSAGDTSDFEGAEVALWTLGRQQDDNPLSLQKYTVDLEGYTIFPHLYIDQFSNVYFRDRDSFPVNRVILIPRETTVQVFVQTEASSDPSKPRSYRSYIQPIHTFVSNLHHRASGYFSTTAIRGNDGMNKNIQRISIQADIPNGTSLRAFISTNGKNNFVPVAVFEADPNNLTKSYSVGVENLPRCNFFSIRIELRSDDGVNTPKVFSVGATYDEHPVL